MGFKGGAKSGGGFLNNVDGAVVAVEWSTIPPGDDAVESEWLYLVPSILVDGADEPVTQHLFFGAAERYDVDGTTVTSLEEDGNPSDLTTFGAKTPAGKFLLSVADSGIADSKMPDLEGGDPLDAAFLVGERFRFVQQKDEEGTKKLGQRKGENGKSYDRTDTVVSTYHGPAKAAKGAKAAPASTKGKAKPAAEEADDDDVSEKAIETIKEVLGEAKNNSLDKAKLSSAILRKLGKDAQREDVRKWAFVDANLAGIDGTSFDKKKGIISLDE